MTLSLDMSFDSIRDYENEIQTSTNKKVLAGHQNNVPKGKVFLFAFI